MIISKKRSAGRPRAPVLLGIGLLLVLAAVLYPALTIAGILSGISIFLFVLLEGVIILGSILFFSAFDAYRKNDQPKITTIRIGLAVCAPIGLILGLFAGDLFTPPFPSPSEITAAAQGVLQFDSFLTVGWVIAFTLVTNWLTELRTLRREVVKIGKVSKIHIDDVLYDLKRLSLSAFVEVAASIFLIVFSAFFAVIAILVAGPISLMLSLLLLGAGAFVMVIGWYDLYLKTENAMSLVDSAPWSEPSTHLPSDEKTQA
jgi:hypothetical protein